MRKSIKIAGVILAGAFIVVQFFQPEKNLLEGPQDHDIIGALDMPEQVVALLKNSCYDCHSNHTRYPWYNKISPVSWFMSKHVQAGKKALNYNEFGLLDQRQMVSTLSKISEEIESGNMPLVSYNLIHRKARLDEEEVGTICDWADAEAGKLMKAGAKP